MEQYRGIIARPHSAPKATFPAVAPANSRITRAKPKQQRRRHTQEEWTKLSAIITQLYIEEDKKAEEVLEVLATQHGFHVGLRKLKDWLKANGLSKNVNKSDMMILCGKRQSRKILEGKKTVIYKDGRILDDARLERFGERSFLEANPNAYLTAATPEGYTYGTPMDDSREPIEPLDMVFGSSLSELFYARKSVETVIGYVPDEVFVSQDNMHRHQVGVLGLRTTSNHQASRLPVVLRQALVFATNLMGCLRSAPKSFVTSQLSKKTTTKTRVPKAHVTFSGGGEGVFTKSLEDRIIYGIRYSEICLELLQLNSADRSRWKEDWYTMTEEEQILACKLGDTFFGVPAKFDSAMAFMHIHILLASVQDPNDPIITRISLGLDVRPYPECDLCHRSVVSVDSISTKEAVQLNVPLRPSWREGWEPPELWLSSIEETARWSEYVSSLNGWFVHMYTRFPNFFMLPEDPEREEEMKEAGMDWEESWDPMDVCTPLEVFQPCDGIVPLYLHTRYDLDASDVFVPGVDPEPKFEPYLDDNEAWNPDGDSSPVIV